MRVTLQQIATHVDLSEATVSRSLRNDPLILPKTRAKVHAAALRLGYEGRPRGSRLRTRPAETAAATPHGGLGLLYSTPVGGLGQRDPNFELILQGAMTEAEHAGMLLMVHGVQENSPERMEDSPSHVPPMIRQNACQALIVWGPVHAEDVAFLSSQVPVVSVGRMYLQSPVDAVVPDSVIGVSTLVAHLAQLGHQRLAWIGGPRQTTFLTERQAGFTAGCLENGLDLNQQRFLGREIFENRRIHDEEKVLQAIWDGATALVCGNDYIAGQVISVAEKSGLRVPQDVSVTGFDAQHAADGGPRLTSIDPHFVELGRNAVWLATKRLAQRSGSPSIMTVRGAYIAGETVAAPRVGALGAGD